MKNQSTSFTEILLLLWYVTLALCVGFVFWFTNWAPVSKFFTLISAVGAALFAIVLYQARVVGALRGLLKNAGHGDQGLFADLYQNSPVPYIRTDKSGQMLHANAAALRLFTLTTEELVQQNIFTMLRAAGDASELKGLTLAQLIAAGQFVNEAEVELVDNGRRGRYALLSAFPYTHNAERLITLIDITQQKAVDIAKSEFVSLASHQLRNPISAIKWNLELLVAASVVPLDQQPYLEKISHSIEKMNTLVDDFLDATKLEMGTFATKQSDVALNAFLVQALEEFESQVVEKSLQLEVALLPEEITLVTDAHLLHMVVGNLISNAVKYTPERGRVQVQLLAAADTITCIVADTGIGVPAADQALLFSKLYRASNTKTSATEGTGLGLYVVKQAAELIGGGISFASEEGGGTVFTVTLPRTV